MFLYNATHQVVVCQECGSCIIPGARSQERHLRAKPHRLSGDVLKTTVQLLNSYCLRTVEELREYAQQLEGTCEAIEHLTSYDGFCCLQPGCQYRTRYFHDVKKHMPAVHKISAVGHKIKPLWKECKLQTYFTGKGLINYFEVTDSSPTERMSAAINSTTPLTESERLCFEKASADYEIVKDEIAKEAGIVHDFEDSWASRVPWLDRLGFLSHLVGLLDDEIYLSHQLPPAKELEGDGSNSLDPVLVRIVNATRSILRDAYQLCSDSSPQRKMTQQRANILNEFYAGASGKSDGFCPRKNESTLVKYFGTWTELVVYYYRVVYAEGGYFKGTSESLQLPQDVIQLTAQQKKTFQEVINAAGATGDDAADVRLKQVLWRFFLALICYVVGSVLFRSPILSFCAMLG
jgi:hypothetical protein